MTFIDNRPGQNAVKLDTQVHKPVVTRITLNTLDDAISYSKGQYGSCCLVEELTIRVNGAMMIDQYEYVHGRHPYCYGETLMKWEFCEGGSDEYTSEQRMLKPWLRRALGLPEGYVIEVRELLA